VKPRDIPIPAKPRGRFRGRILLMRLWPSWPPFRPARRGPIASGSDATRRLLREAEIAAERRTGLVRIAVAAILLVSIVVVAGDYSGASVLVRRQIEAAEVSLVLFGLVGIVGSWFAYRRVWTRSLAVATATADAAIILGNLAYDHASSGISGDFVSAFPVVWVIPIAIAASAIHYRPRLQAYVAGLYLVGLTLIAILAGSLDTGGRRLAAGDLSILFGQPPNLIRLVMMVTAALILILVARQGRALLERAVRETTLRANLTRYLPGELAPILSEEGFSSLRQGRRLRVAILFVDIRDSSALAEGMDPSRLAIFVSAFRRRVMRAAALHGGVVDKFLGDGAMLLFGVPSETPTDAARALACGRTLQDLIERWNAKRRFDPPVRVGIGTHVGDVFCGVVGDDSRLEFTVLGESVNITARIEQATKALDEPFLASREVVEAAGETDRWVEMAHEPLRGMTRPVRLMAPKNPTPDPRRPS
jgi:adenylate cyclase